MFYKAVIGRRLVNWVRSVQLALIEGAQMPLQSNPFKSQQHSRCVRDR